MLNIFHAKDGNLTAEWNGVFLHSSYSPLKEVRKFLDSRLESDSRTIIIMGDPLGYLAREALSRHPELKIIHISLDAAFTVQLSYLNQPCWDPDQDQNLYHFLSTHLTDLDLIHLALLVWSPTTKIFSSLSENCSLIINQFMRERKGSLFTTGGFGKKWLKNSLKNYLNFSRPSLFAAISGKPIFIAASGYSLNQDISVLIKYRHKFALWALPSAVLFLAHHGIVPDLIIQTDPGFYTRYHLRQPADQMTPIAMPLSSSLEYNQFSRPVFLFSQGHFFESFLLDSFDKDYLTLPSTGTVAATAIQLGILSRPPHLIVGGLDLISHDLHEHVSPNGFLPFLHMASHRTSPILNQAYNRTVAYGKKRYEGWQNEQLRTYTEWFNRFFINSPQNLYRLNSSPINLEGIQSITGKDLSDLLSSDFTLEDNISNIDCLLSKEKRILHVEKVLNFFIHTLKEADSSRQIEQEARNPRSLIYHLFTYLSLSSFLSLIKNEDRSCLTNSPLNFSELSDSTISVLEELKRVYIL